MKGNILLIITVIVLISSGLLPAVEARTGQGQKQIHREIAITLDDLPGVQSCQSMGRIVGVVLDRNEALIPNATIAIQGQRGKRKLKSAHDGSFEAVLPAGTYRIIVEASGFRRFVSSPVVVNPDATEKITIHLEVAEPPELVPAFERGSRLFRKRERLAACQSQTPKGLRSSVTKRSSNASRRLKGFLTQKPQKM